VPDKKSLIVSLHDAHPGSRAQIAEQVAFLAEAWHHAQQHPRRAGISSRRIGWGRSRRFAMRFPSWQAAGHEIVLHGYFHDRKESPPRRFRTVFWTRLYTNQEAEFLDLPRETAQAGWSGAEIFESLGWRATGFVAPAWLMAEWPPGVFAEMGFAYTTRASRKSFRSARRNRPYKSSQSLCYSTRASLATFCVGGVEQTSFRKIARDEPRPPEPASARS
jgi:predicted deacetylase